MRWSAELAYSACQTVIRSHPMRATRKVRGRLVVSHLTEQRAMMLAPRNRPSAPSSSPKRGSCRRVPREGQLHCAVRHGALLVSGRGTSSNRRSTGESRAPSNKERHQARVMVYPRTRASSANRQTPKTSKRGGSANTKNTEYSIQPRGVLGDFITHDPQK